MSKKVGIPMLKSDEALRDDLTSEPFYSIVGLGNGSHISETP